MPPVQKYVKTCLINTTTMISQKIIKNTKFFFETSWYVIKLRGVEEEEKIKHFSSFSFYLFIIINSQSFNETMMMMVLIKKKSL